MSYAEGNAEADRRFGPRPGTSSTPGEHHDQDQGRETGAAAGHAEADRRFGPKENQ